MKKPKTTYEEILSTWRHLRTTPAYGECYFNDKLDICAVVYRDYAKVFYDRRMEGEFPACFELYVRVYK